MFFSGKSQVIRSYINGDRLDEDKRYYQTRRHWVAYRFPTKHTRFTLKRLRQTGRPDLLNGQGEGWGVVVQTAAAYRRFFVAMAFQLVQRLDQSVRVPVHAAVGEGTVIGK